MQKTIGRIRIVSLICSGVMLIASFMPFSSVISNTTVFNAVDALYIVLGVAVSAVGYIMWFHKNQLYAKIGNGLIAGLWCFTVWSLILYAMSIAWQSDALGVSCYVHAGWYFMLIASLTGAAVSVITFIMQCLPSKNKARKSSSADRQKDKKVENAPQTPSAQAADLPIKEEKPEIAASSRVKEAFDGRSERNCKLIQGTLRNIQNLFLQKKFGNLTDEEYEEAKKKQIDTALEKTEGGLNEHDRAVVETAIQELLVQEAITRKDCDKLTALPLD